MPMGRFRHFISSSISHNDSNHSGIDILNHFFLESFGYLVKDGPLFYFNIDRDSAASITTAMGGIYIAYSALFVSLQITFFRYFMQSSIGILYVFLFYWFIQDIRMSIEKLSIWLFGLNDRHVIWPSAMLKRWMFLCFIFPGTLYYFSQILFQTIYLLPTSETETRTPQHQDKLSSSIN